MASKDQKEHMGTKEVLARGRKEQVGCVRISGACQVVGVHLLFSAHLLPTMNDQKPLTRIYLLTDQNPAT